MRIPGAIWVPLGPHAHALVVPNPERIVAVLHWDSPDVAENIGGPADGGPAVTVGGYHLVAMADPRDRLVIADEEDSATEPQSRDWPIELLAEAEEEYVEKWGTP